eukprot:COSAG01_NODE_13621_length_1557_cov_4.465580_1_plen_438_part_01
MSASPATRYALSAVLRRLGPPAAQPPEAVVARLCTLLLRHAAAVSGAPSDGGGCGGGSALDPRSLDLVAAVQGDSAGVATVKPSPHCKGGVSGSDAEQRYAPPEMRGGREPGSPRGRGAAEVWAVGIIAAEGLIGATAVAMLTAAQAREGGRGAGGVLERVLARLALEQRPCSKPMRAFLAACLREDALERPSPEALLDSHGLLLGLCPSYDEQQQLWLGEEGSLQLRLTVGTAAACTRYLYHQLSGGGAGGDPASAAALGALITASSRLSLGGRTAPLVRGEGWWRAPLAPLLGRRFRILGVEQLSAVTVASGGGSGGGGDSAAAAAADQQERRRRQQLRVIVWGAMARRAAGSTASWVVGGGESELAPGQGVAANEVQFRHRLVLAMASADELAVDSWEDCSDEAAPAAPAVAVDARPDPLRELRDQGTAKAKAML